MLRLPRAEQRLEQRIAQDAGVERLLQPVQPGFATGVLVERRHAYTLTTMVYHSELCSEQSERGAPVAGSSTPRPRCSSNAATRARPCARSPRRPGSRCRRWSWASAPRPGCSRRPSTSPSPGTTSPCPCSTARGPTPRGTRPRPPQLLAVAAEVIAAAQSRSAGLVLAVFEGGRTDPDLAALARELTDQRAGTARWLVDALAALAPPHADAADDLWLLMDPAIFDRLVRHRGWTPQRYGRWFARTAHALLYPGRTPMTHGRIDYLQLPARDVARSAAFYAAVFGWSVENGSFEAPGMIGQWTTERTPSPDAGPLVWIRADNLFPTLHRVVEAGGRLCERPYRDGAERWLVEVEDPAGNRIGVVVHVRAPQVADADRRARRRGVQPLVPAPARAAQRPRRPALRAAARGRGAGAAAAPRRRGAPPRADRRPRAAATGCCCGSATSSDFDDVVARAAELGAPVVRAPHRNPPEGLRARAPRDLGQRPGRLHGGGREPRRRGHRAESRWRPLVG